MRGRTAILALLGLAAVAAQPAPPDELHFGLRKSEPAAGQTVASPEELRLWFTQEPQANSMTIRLLDAAERPVETGASAVDGEDATLFRVPLERTLPDGTYTVAWRAIGQDGHVVRSTFLFTVAAP